MQQAAATLDLHHVQQQPGSPFQDFTGTIGATTNARWKYSGSLAYDRELFQVGLRWRHTAAFRDASVVTNPASTIAGPGSVNYVDLFGRLHVGEKLEMRVGVTNIGDVEPEQVGSLRGFTSPAIYDVIGRAYYAGFKVNL